MSKHNVKPWTALLEFSANIRTIADHSPELAIAVLALPAIAKATPRA